MNALILLVCAMPPQSTLRPCEVAPPPRVVAPAPAKPAEVVVYVEVFEQHVLPNGRPVTLRKLVPVRREAPPPRVAPVVPPVPFIVYQPAPAVYYDPNCVGST